MSRQSWQERLGELEAHSLADGRIVHVARSFDARRRGLAGLDALPEDHALHILRCGSIHTVGMRFALDLAWLDRSGALVRVDRDVPAWRNRLCRRARSVVEAPAGTIDRFLAAGLVDALA